MRQYRGLTKEGKWVYGWYCEAQDYYKKKHHFITSKDSRFYPYVDGEERIIEPKKYSVDIIEVIPETVGQSTGLKDKNGKGTDEVYEGDIVICSCKSISSIRFKGVITYNAPEFYLACFWEEIDGEQCSYPVGENNRSLIGGEWSVDKIIGTIHTTHPELMEKQ